MKRLRLEKLMETEAHVAFVVAEQTHFGEEFGADGSDSFKHDGITFCSTDIQKPLWVYDFLKLCLAGKGKPYAKMPMVAYKDDWVRLQFVVEAYNDCFKDKPITETIRIQCGDRSAMVTRYVAEPPEDTLVYVARSSAIPAFDGYPYRGHGTLSVLFRYGLLFHSGNDVLDFLNVFKLEAK